MRRSAKTTLKATIQAAIALSIAAVLTLSGCERVDGHKEIHILSTGDVHGAWFDIDYDGNPCKSSLMSVKAQVDSIRALYGEDNVVLIDAGDCLQGDFAAFYYNSEKTNVSHLFPRIAHYLGYDAIVAGNHDVETGHKVYDRVKKELKSKNIPFLGANAISKKNGKAYFDEYTVIRKAGLKILVIGFTNPNIPAWISEELYEGLTFESLLPYAQKEVDHLRAKLHPDVVVVAAHSGTGAGDESKLENQCLDLFKNIKGVDVLIGAHDHRRVSMSSESMAYMNAGSKAEAMGHAVVSMEYRQGSQVSKEVEACLEIIDGSKVDADMHKHFLPEYLSVKEYVNQPIGKLAVDLRSADSFKGMSSYMSLVHTVQLQYSEAQISFAAPLSFNLFIPSGEVNLKDMFSIYRYENSLFNVKLTGREILNHLEESYDTWIQTYDGEHVLRIENGQFVNRYYNFDSAAGLIYYVNVTKPKGDRIFVLSLANGEAFDPDKEYTVAMTSYRCAGHGWNDRVVARYTDIRSLVTAFFKDNGTVDEEVINDSLLLGMWFFIPNPAAANALQKDMDQIFN